MPRATWSQRGHDEPVLVNNVEYRVSDSSLDADERWERFVSLVYGEQMFDQLDEFYPPVGLVDRIERLIGGMKDDERAVRWVMETLPRTINDEKYSAGRELIAVSLSGVLRLKEAIPYLTALLHDDDPEMVGQAVGALSRIGNEAEFGSAVIEDLDGWFAFAGEHFRVQAATVLQHIHSDLSIATLQEWSRVTAEEAEGYRVRQALLQQFVRSEIDRTRQRLKDARPVYEGVTGLQRALVAAALAAGRDFPELDDMIADVRKDMESEPFEDSLGDEYPWEDTWDESDEDWDDEFESGGAPSLLDPPAFDAGAAKLERETRPAFERRIAPITNTGPKVGRNDPCPCGSGKKYKKCCLKK